MAIVRAIITDALIEIGAVAAASSIDPYLGQLGLLRLQNQIDGWAAERLTLSLLKRTPFVMPSGTSSITIGPGGAVNIQRPMFITQINYVIPGSSPAVEVAMGEMDEDSYAAMSIKDLQSALPQQYFYQTNLDDVLGSLFVWPKVTQNVTIVLYNPQAVGVPATLDDDLTGPPGYAEAFMYQLALRLCTPLGRNPPPLLPQLATEAIARMKRPNVDPGLLGIDTALAARGGGYNILSDGMTTGNR